MVTTACNNEDIANRIIQVLLNKKLVSCCQMFPIQSTYWWQGKIEAETEFFIQMKTKKSLYAEVEAEILKLHDYDTAEIACFDIVDGNYDFLNWIITETKNPDVNIKN